MRCDSGQKENVMSKNVLLAAPWQLALITVLVLSAVVFLMACAGTRYIGKSVRSAKEDIAEGNYSSAEDKFKKLKNRSFGVSKLGSEYYLAYTYLAAGEYENFFASVESMRTYRGKVTKIYRTDCVYLLVIARLMLRDGKGAEKAYAAFCNALRNERGYDKKFGVYEKFFEAALAYIGESEEGRTEENAAVIRKFQKDGEGSVLIARLACELVK